MHTVNSNSSAGSHSIATTAQPVTLQCLISIEIVSYCCLNLWQPALPLKPESFTKQLEIPTEMIWPSAPCPFVIRSQPVACSQLRKHAQWRRFMLQLSCCSLQRPDPLFTHPLAKVTTIITFIKKIHSCSRPGSLWNIFSPSTFSHHPERTHAKCWSGGSYCPKAHKTMMIHFFPHLPCQTSHSVWITDVVVQKIASSTPAAVWMQKRKTRYLTLLILVAHFSPGWLHCLIQENSCYLSVVLMRGLLLRYPTLRFRKKSFQCRINPLSGCDNFSLLPCCDVLRGFGLS